MTKRKKISFKLFIVVIVILAGAWSILVGKMYDFNFTEEAKQIYGLPFEPKAPTKVPFREMMIWDSSIEVLKKQVVITLMNPDKDALGYLITNNKIKYPDDLKRKKVMIGEELQGIYYPNNDGKRILYWQEGDLYYEITFFPKITPMEVTKKQLIKMAKSFE